MNSKELSKFEKKLKKKAEVITPDEASDLWVKESYEIESKAYFNRGDYPLHLPRRLRFVNMTPVERYILAELRS